MLFHFGHIFRRDQCAVYFLHSCHPGVYLYTFNHVLEISRRPLLLADSEKLISFFLPVYSCSLRRKLGFADRHDCCIFGYLISLFRDLWFAMFAPSLVYYCTFTGSLHCQCLFFCFGLTLPCLFTEFSTEFTYLFISLFFFIVMYLQSFLPSSLSYSYPYFSLFLFTLPSWAVCFPNVYLALLGLIFPACLQSFLRSLLIY